LISSFCGSKKYFDTFLYSGAGIELIVCYSGFIIVLRLERVSNLTLPFGETTFCVSLLKAEKFYYNGSLFVMCGEGFITV
jgi:hypothetical protein